MTQEQEVALARMVLRNAEHLGLEMTGIELEDYFHVRDVVEAADKKLKEQIEAQKQRLEFNSKPSAVKLSSWVWFFILLVVL